jgi:hypothetical protein
VVLPEVRNRSLSEGRRAQTTSECDAVRGPSDFAIRVSKDGRPDKYVKGSRNRLVTRQTMRGALDVVDEIRPTLEAGEHPAVVPIECVPEEELA